MHEASTGARNGFLWRYGWLLGLLVAVFVTGPALVGALILMGADSLHEALRLTGIFVSLPLLLTGMGLGARMGDGPRFLRGGVVTFGCAGPLLLAVAAMPLGLWPRHVDGWVSLVFLGGVLGFLSGIVLAVSIGGFRWRRGRGVESSGDLAESDSRAAT